MFPPSRLTIPIALLVACMATAILLRDYKAPGVRSAAARQRAEAHIKAREYGLALADLDEASRLEPGYPETYIQRANIYILQGDYARAIVYLDEAMRIDPSSIRPILLRGGVYSVYGDYPKAIADFDETVRRDPRSYAAYGMRANAHKHLGEFGSALEDYNTAIRLNPNEPAIYSDRANFHREMGDYDKAAADFRQAISLDHKTGFNNYAWFLATCPDAAYRDGKQAVEYAIKSCEDKQWQTPHCIDTLAAAYAETGDFEQAINFESRYLTLKPDDKEAQSRLELYKTHKPYRETVKSPGS